MIDASFRKQLTALIAPKTARTYQRALGYFWDWTKDVYGLKKPVYPADPEWVIAYVREHTYGLPSDRIARLEATGHTIKSPTLSVSTLRYHLVPLSIEHKIREVANPCVHPTYLFLMKRLRRRRRKVRQLSPITKDVLIKLLATCKDDLRGVRDRAVLTVGFAGGGRRRSELAALSLEHLEPVKDGYIARLPVHKTAAYTQRPLMFPIFDNAAVMMDEWLRKAKIQSGRVFRGISYYGGIYKKMEPSVVSYIVKYRVKAAGMDRSCYSANSLRAGFMSEAARQGIPLLEAMAISGHRKVDSAFRYYRVGNFKNNAAAHLSIDVDIAD